MKIKEIIDIFQNSISFTDGEQKLLIGNNENELSGVLISCGVNDNVIEEAITKRCNLLICFQPFVIKTLEKLTVDNLTEQLFIKAVKSDLSVYFFCSVFRDFKKSTKILCNKLSLQDTKVLLPVHKSIKKLITSTVPENLKKLREALFEAGAGKIGNYSNCSFNTQGIGTYMGNKCSNPNIGQKLEFIEAQETKIEVFFDNCLQSKVLQALFSNHVYEEVAYEIYNIETTFQNVGFGLIGRLEKPLPLQEFLIFLKQSMNCKNIRHSTFCKYISTVAFLSGSGTYAIKNAIEAKADVFITSDLSYQDYSYANGKIVLVDIGYFESKEFEKNYIFESLLENVSDSVQKIIFLSEAEISLVSCM
ncbi:GTP cyclohydrolase 1 type 2 homolog [Hydra vulgaris]|uniref:GTP cyclohydrolase 1 type 2 homolog n=1 Tax=Hydra vulgaris TaxID=6087 RepID=UPI0001924F75|nr:GTP cyclohydrolase 1 type 2 homolog [Hydra vulgaris]